MHVKIRITILLLSFFWLTFLATFQSFDLSFAVSDLTANSTSRAAGILNDPNPGGD